MHTLMNQHGVIRKEIDYDAFGNVSSESNSDDAAHGYTGAVDQLFKFTGRYTDEDTGLQNNLHRWYDPKIGRWLSQDPIGFAGGDANLYRYVGNEPTGKTDPSGLEERREEIRTLGSVDGVTGAFYQDRYYTWNYFLIFPYAVTTGYGPREFVPDIENGIPDPCGAGSRGARTKINEIANTANAGVEGGKAVFAASVLLLPGPEDAIMVGILARHGMKIVERGGKQILTRAGKALRPADELAEFRRLSNELMDARRSAVRRKAGIDPQAKAIRQGSVKCSGDATRWWEFTNKQGKTKIMVEHADGSVHIGRPKPHSPHRDGGLPKYYEEFSEGHIPTQ